jgi:integration host factor subunit beta
MTRSELIEVLAQKSEISREKATLVVNCILDNMVRALCRGERIEIRNFGNFVVREYDSYVGRNPKSGVKVMVPKKRVPFFKAGLELKRMVNGEDA